MSNTSLKDTLNGVYPRAGTSCDARPVRTAWPAGMMNHSESTLLLLFCVRNVRNRNCLDIFRTVPFLRGKPIFYEIQRIQASHHCPCERQPLQQSMSALFIRTTSRSSASAKNRSSHCPSPRLDDFCKLLPTVGESLSCLAGILPPLIALPTPPPTPFSASQPPRKALKLVLCSLKLFNDLRDHCAERLLLCLLPTDRPIDASLW